MLYNDGCVTRKVFEQTVRVHYKTGVWTDHVRRWNITGYEQTIWALMEDDGCRSSISGRHALITTSTATSFNQAAIIDSHLDSIS